MALRLDLPTAARRLPLDHPDHAIAEFVALVADLKDGGEGILASLEPRVTEVVESVLASGATYLAVLISDTAAPAVLTAAPVTGPAQARGPADVLRDAVDLKRHKPGQLTHMPRSQPAPGHADGARDDKLGIQRSSCPSAILVDAVLTGTPLLASRG